MPRSHDVGEREEGWHQRVVHVAGETDECPVRVGNPDGLALSAVNVTEAISAAVEALAL